MAGGATDTFGDVNTVVEENEADFDVINDIPAYRLDSRPKLLIFSLSYRLSDVRKVP